MTNDLIAGVIPVGIDVLTAFVPYFKSGQVVPPADMVARLNAACNQILALGAINQVAQLAPTVRAAGVKL